MGGRDVRRSGVLILTKLLLVGRRTGHIPVLSSQGILCQRGLVLQDDGDTDLFGLVAVVPIILDVLRIPRASKDPRCFPGTGRDGSSTFFGRTLRMGKWLTCSPMKRLWYTCGRKRNGVPPGRTPR
mgnify:CR=1 FL=1